MSLANVTTTSVYKPPASEFEWPPLPERCRRPLHLVIGDFNSHSTTCGAMSRMTARETSWKHGRMPLTSLSSTMQNYPSILTVARWKRGYNPDVAFVSTRIASMCQRDVLDPIPCTQHRPITITIRSLATATHWRRRFNLKKANWSKFSNEIDQFKPLQISQHTQITTMTVELAKKAARHNIPRGCQKEYIPAPSDESSDLLKLYDEE